MSHLAESESESKAHEQEYRKCREAYDKAELEVSGRYDHWILVLATGALALSITFIEKLAPKPIPSTLCYLEVSWLFLVLSILTGVLSLLFSQSAIREQRKNLDDLHTTGPGDLPSQRCFFSRLTNVLNWAAALSFVAGVAFLCIFAFQNL